MKPKKLVLRCYADDTGGYWTAYCLDLTLYATGNSFEEAKYKLDEEIEEYIAAATDGPDAQFIDQLIPRRAPLGAWLRYYRSWFQCYFFWLIARLRPNNEKPHQLVFHSQYHS